MWLGTWKGISDGHEATWLRFYDREGRLLPTGEEKHAALTLAEAARADAATSRANAAA